MDFGRGSGKMARGDILARRKAASERRRLIEASGTPAQRNAVRSPYRGSVDFLERFWAHVVVGAPDACWEWRRHTDDEPDGKYGTLTLRSAWFRAHRISYELSAALELSPEIFACHTCDNPPCCNPAHLFPGTNTDNQQDSLAKGRHHNASRTHCRRGHELTADNIVAEKRAIRRCRECTKRAAMKNYHLRNGNPEKAATWAL